jgi:hypothetical protein
VEISTCDLALESARSQEWMWHVEIIYIMYVVGLKPNDQYGVPPPPSNRPLVLKLQVAESSQNLCKVERYFLGEKFK